MYQMVKLAGDTDTNCAIVGGMIGAFTGIDNIDMSKVKKVLECQIHTDYTNFNGGRPAFMQPGRGCIDEMIQLMAIAP